MNYKWMYEKLDKTLYVKDESKKVRDIEKLYAPTNVFQSVQSEFEAIASIIDQTNGWMEVE